MNWEERKENTRLFYKTWKEAGYEINRIESGETDVGGNPISGSLVLKGIGSRNDEVVGSWGPWNHENVGYLPNREKLTLY